MEDMNSADQGMMSPSEMAELATKSDKSFDRQFLNMMIDHHLGASKWPRRSRQGESIPQPLRSRRRFKPIRRRNSPP